MATMEGINNYIEEHKDRFLEELFELIRIPSVSAMSDSGEYMADTCKLICTYLMEAGADKTQVFNTEGWPIVYAEKIIDEFLPTILVYGHYDVQPAEPFELWDSPPFEPEIRNGKIYARGADDDKGQLFMHLKAFEFMVRENKLPCNVKFIIEGEEEVGSKHLGVFCGAHKELLQADVVLVSDTTIFGIHKPSLTIGLRGMAYFDLVLQGPNRDLHSGLYGGAVNNPGNVLGKVIASLLTENGKVQIPGFYKDVQDVKKAERDLLNSVGFSEEGFALGIGLEKAWGENGYSTLERLGIRPSLDINGVFGGHTGEGAKTIIPSKVSAKLSMRLVPNQDPEKIKNLLLKYVENILPEGISVTINMINGGNPYVLPWESPEANAAICAMEKTFGIKPVPVRSGGSIPVISVMEKELGVKSVLMGFGLETDAIHSPNENYPLENFYKGIETIPWFYQYFCSNK